MYTTSCNCAGHSRPALERTPIDMDIQNSVNHASYYLSHDKRNKLRDSVTTYQLMWKQRKECCKIRMCI